MAAGARLILMCFPRRLKAAMCVSLLSCALFGCANPGPPKPPSLQIPAIARDLSAIRRGDAVNLQFTLPQRTSDGVLLRSPTLSAHICRAVDAGPCIPVPAKVGYFAVPGAPKTPGNLRDELPRDLIKGPARLLTYRVELMNARGRGAGFSDAAYTAAGSVPQPVMDLEAQGTREGVLLRWKPSDNDAKVLLLRKQLSTRPLESQPSATRAHATGSLEESLFGRSKPQPDTVTLDAAGVPDALAHSSKLSMTLDATAEPGTKYRYSAERRRTVNVAGHTVEMWSGAAAAPTSSIIFTLQDTFPPPVPSNLSVAGFMERDSSGAAKGFSVDLIWEPVRNDRLAGYNVYRDELTPSAATAGLPKVKRSDVLTPTPVKLPAFHDTTASASKRYRYRVTSVDSKGNESEAASAALQPQLY